MENNLQILDLLGTLLAAVFAFLCGYAAGYIDRTVEKGRKR